MYNVIGDEKELKWFFDHVIQKPLLYESYLSVFVCRHKKLTEEEKQTLGLSRKTAEFLAHQSFRLSKDSGWTFRNFLMTLKRFNVDDGAYLTDLDTPLPTKTLAVLFYVNPCDDIKVCQKLVDEYNEITEAILKAHLNGKSVDDCITGYRWFTNAANRVKHLQANQKGSVYYMDYDIDVPKWWKEDKFDLGNNYVLKPYTEMLNVFNETFGKGNYIVIDTSGGYHVLVKTSAIHSNPHNVCNDINAIYDRMIIAGAEEYVDEKGNCKFECTINDSQIPGIPLPGTLQYGRTVTVINKDDFEEGFRHSKVAHKIIKKENQLFSKDKFKYFSTYKGYRILQASLNPHNSEYCVEELGLDTRWSSLNDCKEYIKIVLSKEDSE